MADLTEAQLEGLWLQAGGQASLAPTMAAIAEAESSGNTTALNDNPATKDYSVGPWQINYYGSLLAPRTAEFGSPNELLANPLLDAKAAVSLAAGGQGLSNWSTYNSGAYRGYLGALGSTAPPISAGAPLAQTENQQSGSDQTTREQNSGFLSSLDDLINPSNVSLFSPWSAITGFLARGGITFLGLGLIVAGLMIIVFGSDTGAMAVGRVLRSVI